MLPLSCAQSERGVRRLGFHGLSYEYMTVALPERHGNVARGRTIVAHLGRDASLCAMRELKSVATTTGFSVDDCLMTANRCRSFAAGDANPERAALDLYAHRIVREIGALTAVLGGVDMLAFTGGAHSPVLRERICRVLAWLGLHIDPAANRANAHTISKASSPVRVAVEPKNEEWIAASHALAVTRARSQSSSQALV